MTERCGDRLGDDIWEFKSEHLPLFEIVGDDAIISILFMYIQHSRDR